MERRGSTTLEQIPRLEQYELLEEVGHGGMATVYRALDPRLDREVAVKIIHRHLRENAEVAARFTSEAKAVAKLRHPNIVEVYDVSREEDVERFLVVELVHGTTLRALLAEHPELPPEIGALLTLEVAKALEHAHAHGVVHRDIKPENVLVSQPQAPTTSETPPIAAVDPQGTKLSSSPRASRRPLERGRDTPRSVAEPLPPRIKLTDFGIAKVLDVQGVTSTGQVLGSPAHMAPEQIEGGEVDERADVFGLGVLLYETMVGKLPFHGKNPAQVLRRVLDGLYEPAVKERPEVGAEWSALLDRALAKLPEDRFQSIHALSEAATRILEDFGFADGQRELALYFADPAGYRAGYKERMVSRLAERARRARTAGNVVLASQLFNRALAFKPGDPDLLKQISGLARRAELKRVAVRAGGIVLGSLALGAAAFGITHWVKARQPAQTAPSATPVAASVRAEPELTSTAQRTTQAPSALASAQPRRTPWKRLPGFRAEPKVSETRMVQVVIQGPASGTAQVDGKPAPFGAQFALSVGPHVFRFVPTDDKCCVADPAERTVTIEPGDTVKYVYGKIKARNATLSVTGGPAGSTVRCPALFPGVLASPGERSIPMGQMKSTGACTLHPPEASGAAQQTKSALVHAGQVTTLSF